MINNSDVRSILTAYMILQLNVVSFPLCFTLHIKYHFFICHDGLVLVAQRKLLCEYELFLTCLAEVDFCLKIF